MKSRLKVWIAMMFAALFVGGCACMPSMPKVQMPSAGHGKMAGFAFSTDQKQMSGVSRSSLKLAVGESAVVFVRGTDDKGTWFELPAETAVTWKCDKEVEIAPQAGPTVTIKAVSAISASAFVTASGVNEAGEKVEAMLQVSN